ncbi:MAG: type II secretion system protein GspG [Chthoniobacterales bacterium]
MRHEDAFTIVEVIVVMAIILVLAGLILGTAGYVHNKAARSRAQAEIQAMSAGLESYKADNGIYPSDTTSTDTLDAKTATPDYMKYQAASAILYAGLSGDTNSDGQAEAKAYMTFKANQLSTTTTPFYVQDPFGSSYGYSTAGQAANGGAQTVGYNPTFDLWSTAGPSNTAGQTGWIKNW